MLIKRLGNIFKGNLPSISNNNTTIALDENNIILGNFSILANYTRFVKNQNIFRTFIEIDVEKAQELNLSYFKTSTINTHENSKYFLNNKSYTALLDETKTINLRNFISQNNESNIKYDLIKKDILGRNLNLNDSFNKQNIITFTNRKSYNYNSGITLKNTANAEISKYQDIFFELAFSTFNDQSSENLSRFSSNNDLIIYAMNSNDEIIDVKVINNFNILNVNWNTDLNTFLFNIDDIDFDKLLSVSFSQSVYNNLTREMYLSCTNIFRNVCNSNNFALNGASPIDFISIQENDLQIEQQNLNININLNTFENNDNKLKITFNKTLNILRADTPIDYRLFMKIAGTNNYFIKSFSNILKEINIFELIQNESFTRYFANSRIDYFPFTDIIQVNLSLLKSAINTISFNPYLLEIFINNSNVNLIDRCFSVIPNDNSIPDLDLTNNTLYNLFSNSTSNESHFVFYLLNNSQRQIPNTLNITFEQNYKKYYVSFPIQINFNTGIQNQKLKITYSEPYSEKNSNLNINYKLDIENIKTTNTDFTRFLLLGYENIFLQDLQNTTDVLDENFNNDISIIVKKSIYQQNENVKDKYYIFNKSNIINNFTADISDSLNIELNYKDDFSINHMFFNDLNEYDNIIDTKDVKYIFEAKVMILPLGFFSSKQLANNSWLSKNKIKKIIMANNPNYIPNTTQINEIFQILYKLNQQSWKSLKQIYLYKLYENFCLQSTTASDQVVLSNKLNINNNQQMTVLKSTNVVELNDIKSSIKIQGINKTLSFTLSFNILQKESDNLIFISEFNKISSFYNDIYYLKQSNLTKISDSFTFKSVLFINKLNQNTTKTISISDNTIKVKLEINITDELLTLIYPILFNNLSLNLKDNLYMYFVLPDLLSSTNNLHEIFIQNRNLNLNLIPNTFKLIDFYSFF